MYPHTMVKNWDPKAPPMRLEESQRLYKDATNSAGSWNKFQLLSMELGLLGMLAVWVFGLASAAYFGFKSLMFVTHL